MCASTFERMQANVESVDDYQTYSELESSASNGGSSEHDESDFIEMVPLARRMPNNPISTPPPRSGSSWSCQRLETRSQSTTGCSIITAHARCPTITSGCSSTARSRRRTSVIKNKAYRNRSPDVIPSLSKTPCETVQFVALAVTDKRLSMWSE